MNINGDRPWDMQVHNEDLYARVIKDGSLGLGEAYMDGWWDVPALDQFFHKILAADLGSKVCFNWTLLMQLLKAQLMNLQSSNRAYQVGEQHYDLDNELFGSMLDKNMIYSCGYWKNATCIDEAQEHKLDLICKKLNLQPGMTMLDIGCGIWRLAAHAAKNYGVAVTGITISKEQAKHALEMYKDLPITIAIKDYRDLHEKFDRVVSGVGMFEHVGYKNYKTFMAKAHSCLKDRWFNAFAHYWW